jgi:hypothetical protein
MLILAVGAALVTPSRAQAVASPLEACPPPSAPASGVPSSSAAANSTQPASSQLVACVDSQTIRRAVFLHWLNVAKKADGGGVASERVRGRGQLSKSRSHAHELLTEVMGFLISSDWVIGEAQDLNVGVSDVEVRRSFDRLRRAQFPKHGEFTAFLRTTGQTVADLLFRVRLNLLSVAIQMHVVAGQHGGSAQEQALSRFVGEFKSKWLAQTYCLPAYAVSDCGHVQAVL